MKEFVIKLFVDKYFSDTGFINNKIKELTVNKENVRIISMTTIPLQDFNVEFDSEALSPVGNCLFFWDGKESLGKAQIRSALESSSTVRVVRYDLFPVKAWIGVRWSYPKTKYKIYEKLFDNWHHMNNWINKCKGDINGLEYRIQPQKQSK